MPDTKPGSDAKPNPETNPGSEIKPDPEAKANSVAIANSITTANSVTIDNSVTIGGSETKARKIDIVTLITVTASLVAIITYFSGKNSFLSLFNWGSKSPDSAKAAVVDSARQQARLDSIGQRLREDSINHHRHDSLTARELMGPHVTDPQKTPDHPQKISAPPPSAAKRAPLGLQMTGPSGQWDNNLADSLVSIFTAKGAHPIETSPGSKEYSFDNIVSYRLTPDAPEEDNGDVNYKFTLTLQFYSGKETRPCTSRIYQAMVSKRKSDKDGIVEQAVADVMAQLRNVKTFPFCIKKT